MCIVTSFQKVPYEKNVEMCNFDSEEAWWTIPQPDDQCQCLHVNMNHVDKMHPWYVMRMAIYFCGLPPI